MTITTKANTFKAQLDAANPNNLSDMLQAFKIGSFLRAMPVSLAGVNVHALGTSPYSASNDIIVLPDDAKACALLRAEARAGTGTKGLATLNAPFDTPNANLEVAITPSGDISFYSTDAFSDVEVVYLPAQYDLYEFTLPVATNTLTLPAAFGACLFVSEIESLVGTLVSKLIVDKPGTSVSTGHAALGIAKKTVVFASADAVTSARVKVAYPALVGGVSRDTLLEGASGNFV